MAVSPAPICYAMGHGPYVARKYEYISWGKVFIEKTFVRTLSPDSLIYDRLNAAALTDQDEDLDYMDMHVGEDDPTADKDYKHEVKRGRNRLLTLSGSTIFGTHINPAIIRLHFADNGSLQAHLDSVLRPDDKQDVDLALQLCMDLWRLAPAPEAARPGYTAAHEALRIIGSLHYHFIFPYICVDLSLAEQLEHLSAAAHLALILYRDGGKNALPTLLYTDLMITIKNIFFCVAKAKVDDPLGKFWLILLGTDRLKTLFGILRTMIGVDRNMDILQLVERITGSTEIANILATHPEWDRSRRRLKLPMLTRDCAVVPSSADHLKPSVWRGDTSVMGVSLLTCWNRGLRGIRAEFPTLTPHFDALADAFQITILAPWGELLVHKELDPDDVEDDGDEAGITMDASTPASHLMATDLEDAVAEECVSDDSERTFSKFVLVNGQQVHKGRFLSGLQRYGYKVGSTNHLKRVANESRYALSPPSLDTITETDKPYILISEPIAMLVRVETQLFVAIGEVTNIFVNSNSVEQLGINDLRNHRATIKFQPLSLTPATAKDDPTLKYDWRTRAPISDDLILSAPGRLVLPVDPALLMPPPDSGDKLFYLLDSSTIRVFGADLFSEITLELQKAIPKLAVSPKFPYRESSGAACFLCEGESSSASYEDDSTLCVYCNTSLDLNHPQQVLTHIGAHVLHEPHVYRSKLPCGLCGRPHPHCSFVLARGHGGGDSIKIDRKSSNCPNFVKDFSYASAAKVLRTSPLSNVPLRCPECGPQDPVVWRYNLLAHLRNQHPRIQPSTHGDLWQLGSDETTLMCEIYEKIQRGPQRQSKKTKPVLVISEAHSSRLALVHELDERECDGEVESQPGSPNEELSSLDGLDVFEKTRAPSEHPPSPPTDYNTLDVTEDDADTEVSALFNPVDMEQLEFGRTDDNVPALQSTAPTPPAPSSETLVNPANTLPQPRRSARKRALNDRNKGDNAESSSEVCICGENTDPGDNHIQRQNVAQCKNLECETGWFHLACLQLPMVHTSWMCDPCIANKVRNLETEPKRRKIVRNKLQ